MVRMTKQKKDLYESLGAQNSFFGAEELHATALKRNSKIGIATVYRFLKTAVEKGELHSYLCEGRSVYSQNKNNHCHFRCESCGKVEHVDVKKLDFLSKRRQKGIRHFQIDMTGICEDCS